MIELVSLLSVYYQCASLAHDHQLTQTERFACNETFQQAKRQFLAEDFRDPSVILTPEQHVEAYLLFKAWEAENPELIRRLKTH